MKRNIPFLKYRFVAYFLSLGLLILFIVGAYTQGGLNWGIDFLGGTKLIAKFKPGIAEKEIRAKLKDKFPNISVQQIGAKEKNQYIVATKLKQNSRTSTENLDEIWTILKDAFPETEKLNVETVGPAIGGFLRKSALELTIIAVVLMTIYLTFRFEFRFALGAMIALVHDILLSIAFCGAVGVEINIPIIAALLTIFGYSVNDTIVIFDRIRENIDAQSAAHFSDIINKGINQSISRTLLTSFTTLIAVASLYILGSDVIKSFALVLLFGVIVGTYSSIYVASPVVYAMSRFFGKKIAVK